MLCHHRRAPDRSRSGSTLALSLLVVLTMVILSGTFLQMSATITGRQSQAADQKRAFYVAEAGLAEGYAALRIGKTGTIGSEEDPARFGDGLFWVTATELGNGLIGLESHGCCGTAKADLDLVVTDGSSSVAALGMFSVDDLTVPSGSLLDAYDSRSGPYESPDAEEESGGGLGIVGVQELGTTAEGGVGRVTKIEGPLEVVESIGSANGARVSSNGNVTIHEDLGDETRVFGDLRAGRNQTLTTNGDPEVTGSTDTLVTTVHLPPVQVPQYEQRSGYAHNRATPLVLPTMEGHYEFLDVAANCSVTITGPTRLVLQDLTLDAGSELVLDTTGGPIHLYVENGISFADGSFLSTPGEDPTQVSLQYSGVQPVDFLSTGAFHGLVYAPSAALRLDGSQEIFGAAIANSIEATGPLQLHFDHALGRSAEDAAVPRLASWRIVELVGNASPTGDPFTEMGVVRDNLSFPSESHADQLLQMEYYDRTGTRSTYDGLESSFDWSNVKQVLALERDGETVGDVQGLSGIGGIGDGTGLVGVGDDRTLTEILMDAPR